MAFGLLIMWASMDLVVQNDGAVAKMRASRPCRPCNGANLAFGYNRSGCGKCSTSSWSECSIKKQANLISTNLEAVEEMAGAGKILGTLDVVTERALTQCLVAMPGRP